MSDPFLVSTRVLVFGGIAAPGIFTGMSLIDAMTQPGYNLLTDYVSDLSWMSDGWMTVVAFMLSGWLLIGFAVALCKLAEAGSSPSWGPILVGIMGFGLIAAGAFEIDPTWGRLTLHGELHWASTVVVGGSIALASLLAWRDRRREHTQGSGSAFLWMGLACVVLFAASMVLPSQAWPGLLERVALLIGAAWVAAFAWAVYPGRRPVPARHEFERNGMAA